MISRGRLLQEEFRGSCVDVAWDVARTDGESVGNKNL
jgi:hypothetical protein